MSKLFFLGTGAAEGIPSPFCDCQVCNEARIRKGKNIKTRSCLLLNETILIDLSPDIFLQNIIYDINLSKVKNIIFTHSHLDHLDLFSLMLRCRDGATILPNLCDENNFINIYGNEKVKYKLDLAFLEQPYATKKRIKFHLIEAHKSFCVNGLSFYPIKANHILNENCYIYVIQDNTSTFLYGNDTGFLESSEIKLLSHYPQVFDLISLDCSRGTLKGNSHMGLDENLYLIKVLKENKKIDDNTKIYLNHFSHMCGILPENFEELIQKYGMHLTYDGLQIYL